jgi:predicted dehydrogenase
MRVRVGIAGIGKMGKIHARILSELNEYQFVGIYDTDFKEASTIAEKYSVKVYQTLEELLESVDALIISTPTSTHKEVAIKAIEMKKHVFVEKPLAATSKDALEIYEEAKKQNVILMVGHVERFNPVIQKLKEILSDKKPLIISITRVGPFPPRIKDTGIILDLGIHDIDILNYLLESDPDKVSCLKNSCTGNYEDIAIISLKYGNCLAHILTNWLTPFKVRKIELATENDYFVGNLIDQKLTRYTKYTEEGSYIAYEIPVRYKEPIKEELLEFYAAITEKREPLVDGKVAVKNILIAEKCLSKES